MVLSRLDSVPAVIKHKTITYMNYNNNNRKNAVFLVCATGANRKMMLKFGEFISIH